LHVNSDILYVNSSLLCTEAATSTFANIAKNPSRHSKLDKFACSIDLCNSADFLTQLFSIANKLRVFSCNIERNFYFATQLCFDFICIDNQFNTSFPTVFSHYIIDNYAFFINDVFVNECLLYAPLLKHELNIFDWCIQFIIHEMFVCKYVTYVPLNKFLGNIPLSTLLPAYLCSVRTVGPVNNLNFSSYTNLHDFDVCTAIDCGQFAYFSHCCTACEAITMFLYFSGHSFNIDNNQFTFANFFNLSVDPDYSGQDCTALAPFTHGLRAKNVSIINFKAAANPPNNANPIGCNYGNSLNSDWLAGAAGLVLDSSDRLYQPFDTGTRVVTINDLAFCNFGLDVDYCNFDFARLFSTNCIVSNRHNFKEICSNNHIAFNIFTHLFSCNYFNCYFCTNFRSAFLHYVHTHIGFSPVSNFLITSNLLSLCYSISCAYMHTRYSVNDFVIPFLLLGCIHTERVTARHASCQFFFNGIVI
jgi:hypothetical protein